MFSIIVDSFSLFSVIILHLDSLNFVQKTTLLSNKSSNMERKSKNKDVKLVVWFLILIHAIITLFSTVFAQVSISKPSLQFGYCALPSNYQNIGDIIIVETDKADFATGSSRTFHIPAPPNFEFQPNTGTTIALNGRNLSAVTTTVSALSIIVQYTCSAVSKFDQLTISGLAIRAINTSSTGTLKRNGGNAVISGMGNNTELSLLISSSANANSTFRTVSSISGTLDWNQTSTWECGFIPPNDGTASIIIQAFNGAFSVNNGVVFSGSKLIKSMQVETNANFSPGIGTGHVMTITQDFTLKNGSYLRQRNWIQNGINSLKIGGNFTNNGEMITDGSNNNYDFVIEMNGTNPQSIQGSGIFRLIGNGNQTSKLIITNPTGVSLKSNFSSTANFGDPGEILVNGHLIFDSDIIQLTGTGTLQLNGKVTLRAPTFYGNCAMSGLKTISNTSTVEFTHPNSSISQTTISTLNLNNLELTVGNVGKLTLTNTVKVGGILIMNSGTIRTGSNSIELGTSTSNLGSLTYNSGFINGRLKRWFNSINTGNSSGLFPLSDPNELSKRFVLIEYQENTVGGSLQAEWVENPMGNDFQTDFVQTGCSAPFQITKTASGFWSINPDNGITVSENRKYKITLTAEAITDFSNACTITALKKEGFSPWSQSGFHVDNQGNASSPIVQRIEATGWSNWGFAGDDQPLPVELTNFSCKKNQENTIIEWTTASESNSMFFELYRSEDGENWEVLTTKNAAGYSNSTITYSEIDTERIVNPYYLLKQVDFDGKYKIYGPITVYSNSEKLFNFYMSSNSINSDLTVYVVNPFGLTDAYLTIKDCVGKEIENKKLTLENGMNTIEIQTFNKEKGVYYFTLTIPTKYVKTIKQVILK
jgi:hypothetical protein